MVMKFLTVPEIAEMLQMDQRTVRSFIQKGDLTAVKIGAEYRILEDDFIEFINRNKTKRGGQESTPREPPL